MEQQTDRQRWLSVLAHSSAALLETHWQALNLQPAYTLIRPAEIGLTRLQARMGATGKRFVMGDATVTRAVVQLSDGTLGYSYLLGRDKAHAERCALLDALLQQPETRQLLEEKIITPLAAWRDEQRQLRAREIASSKVDFFTLVRGDN
ncbi:alpha-D-ribose 1-methylphosphonate 5-triphosphate synthase subunit PhnG [Pantoea agglomerans]|jgi:alpha-D-ribose 1-methylphosphonate 5-triphosphate synthase subunit PhnG|nr:MULTISPECIES: phosphonate C-P lyase system protein PhnG [Pantoea]MDF9911003.1 alpha-D-ribose 1-methylphosphonate 5-triphosphate synthase subunit PhnG [Pantoea brenneri]KGD78518.1 phosphonate C-P lyase [Pantoea agglomerans]MBA8863149.1 alpha-D-ribose 1-methylphosphonate 5-triphosphate synthase subunit PhnG [Pantoea agglomerans]MBA8868505.1 alpha-D-ribose 1-methylphosphonate 5-triphosphate synthase subunit PhnG [Pantoea agglomerans]MBA8873506.1 alpha-D-ribose 1-methylphosphonate 5-triphosphat